MKRMMALLTLCLLLAVQMAYAQEERVFVDSLGREVLLPQEIDRVAVTGSMAQMPLMALAPEKMVGIAEPWDDTARQYLSEQCVELPVLGQFYGGELNLETLLSSGAQVVVDIGEPKGTIVEDMNALTEQTGIPFVHITMGTATMGDAYLKLGELLGEQERAQSLADYCMRTYAEIQKIAGRVEKARILYITGEKGVNVIAKGSYQAEIIDLLADNLAVVDNPSARGTGNEVDMEQIIAWDPDILFFSPESVYETADRDPLYQQLTAIQTGRYYEVPRGPFNWMGFPPSVQRLLGMQWMTKVLYPDAAEYDFFERAREYFELFYHVELTREQYDGLVEHSLGK